jgi:hypothetical protein
VSLLTRKLIFHKAGCRFWGLKWLKNLSRYSLMHVLWDNSANCLKINHKKSMKKHENYSRFSMKIVLSFSSDRETFFLRDREKRLIKHLTVA